MQALEQENVIILPDMRKCVALQPLAEEMFMDCGHFMLTTLNFSLIHFLEMKY